VGYIQSRHWWGWGWGGVSSYVRSVALAVEIAEESRIVVRRRSRPPTLVRSLAFFLPVLLCFDSCVRAGV
jgi:hypothetical protein